MIGQERPSLGLSSVEYPADSNLVYVTTDQRCAKRYAAMYLDETTLRIGGGLCNVKPIGELSPNPERGRGEFMRLAPPREREPRARRRA
jgi:hypothetical protein